MLESHYRVSLRWAYTVGLALCYLPVLLRGNTGLSIRNMAFICLVIIYACLYFILGAGNNLIYHLLTICLGTSLIYATLIGLKADVHKTWIFAKKAWIAIYLTLVLELLVAMLGFQGALYGLFPETMGQAGLPGYRILDNSYANYFSINFYGLNSVILQAQAYGQLCVMLTIFGFMSLENSSNIKKWKVRIVYILIPLLIFLLSPNITAVVILGAIIVFTISVRLKLKMDSSIKVGMSIIAIIVAIALISINGVGFFDKYQFSELYDIFLEKQVSFLLGISLKDLVIGVGLDEYYKEASVFEVAIVSYASVAGLVFVLINSSVVAYYFKNFFTYLNRCNIKDKMNNKLLEIVCMNALVVMSMLLSFIHFPVFTSYLGGLIFMFHLAFGLYLLRNQKSGAFNGTPQTGN